jgi:hypothetical protein
LVCAVEQLSIRGIQHDKSKLESPEVEIFNEFTPKLKGSTYPSPEYDSFLKGMKVGLDHHYAHNSHHPEHRAGGINDMDLFDIMEMLLDWKAATERHGNGDIYRSLEHNRKRFKMTRQLQKILRNTVDRYVAKW